MNADYQMRVEIYQREEFSSREFCRNLWSSERQRQVHQVQGLEVRPQSISNGRAPGAGVREHHLLAKKPTIRGARLWPPLNELPLMRYPDSPGLPPIIFGIERRKTFPMSTKLEAVDPVLLDRRNGAPHFHRVPKLDHPMTLEFRDRLPRG